MSGFDAIIRNADVLTGEGLVARDLALSEGRIAALLPRGDGTAHDIVEGAGLTVLPGAIDIHCHVRAPAFPERGTVETETRAAAAGGVTTLFEMPISRPCCNSADRLAVRREHFAEHAFVDFGLYVAPGEMTGAEIAAMRGAGAIAFKFFTTATPPGREDEFAGLSVTDEGRQLAVLEAAAATGLPVVVHAESQALLDRHEAAAGHLDRSLATTHTAARPAICEALAVAQVLTLNIRAQARLHIAHVTSALTVDILRRFAGSSDFSAETCPHYLTHTEADLVRAGVYGKVNPPLRQAADREALWAALDDGTIGHVATDHAAFSRAEKAASATDFLGAPPGTPGLEMLVPVLLDAVDRGRLTLGRASALVNANAARRFNLWPEKGAIAPGFDADLVVVDRKAETRISAAALFTQGRDVAGLYEGMSFTGAIRQTIVGGRTVFRDGAITGEPGWGRGLQAINSGGRAAACCISPPLPPQGPAR